MDPQPRPKDFSLKWQIGWCKASKKEVPLMEDPQFSLFKAPESCEDFELGKPRKKRPTKKEEKLQLSNTL